MSKYKWYDDPHAKQHGPAASFPDFTGSGSPEGVVTAPVGKFYADTAGALYVKTSGAGNTGWAQIGGLSPNADPAPGFGLWKQNGGTGVTRSPAILASGDGGDLGEGSSVGISDIEGWFNSGNGIYYNAFGPDGDQDVRICLGPNGSHAWQFRPDGSTSFPGPLLLGEQPLAGPPQCGNFALNGAGAALPANQLNKLVWGANDGLSGPIFDLSTPNAPKVHVTSNVQLSITIGVPAAALAAGKYAQFFVSGGFAEGTQTVILDPALAASGERVSFNLSFQKRLTPTDSVSVYVKHNCAAAVGFTGNALATVTPLGA